MHSFIFLKKTKTPERHYLNSMDILMVHGLKWHTIINRKFRIKIINFSYKLLFIIVVVVVFCIIKLKKIK